MTSDEILAAIESRLAQVNDQVAALQRARAVLDAENSPASQRRPSDRARPRPDRTRASTPPSPDEERPQRERPDEERPERERPERARQRPRSPASRRRAGRVRRARQLPSESALEVLLQASDGLSTSRIAEQAEADRDRVLILLREMERAGRVRRLGERRATRWQIITDEERIVERAAELAARASRRDLATGL